MDAPTSPTSTDPASPAGPAPEHRSAFRPNRLTSGIVAGGAAFAMVLAGLGIASAQTDGATTTTPPAASTEGTTTPPPGSAEGAGDGAAGGAAPGDAAPGAGPGGRHHRHPVANKARIASVIGITVEELETQLRAGKTIAAVAGDKTDEVVAALVAEATERLDAGVAAGRLTQAEADERKSGLQERFTTLVNRTPPADGERGGKPGGRGAGKASLGVAASTLGMTEEALRTELRSGKTLAAIAGDRTPALIEALVADAQARLDQAVADGKLTAEQAAERKADLTEHITAKVNSARPAGRGHRHGEPPAADGAAPEAAPASVTA